jgi:hypothetical protein
MVCNVVTKASTVMDTYYATIFNLNYNNTVQIQVKVNESSSTY